MALKQLRTTSLLKYSLLIILSLFSLFGHQITPYLIFLKVQLVNNFESVFIICPSSNPVHHLFSIFTVSYSFLPSLHLFLSAGSSTGLLLSVPSHGVAVLSSIIHCYCLIVMSTRSHSYLSPPQGHAPICPFPMSFLASKSHQLCTNKTVCF